MKRRAFRSAIGSCRASAGYTLIEIIVAFAILALGLTLLLGTLSGATRQVREAGDAGRAALHAQSLLDEFGNLPQPQQRDGELEQGRYRWQLDVEPWQEPSARKAAAPVDPNGAQLMRLHLQLEWGEGTPAQRFEVTSLRLVVPQVAGVSAP